jgi:uncharacterized membrane protein/protein-disulfide isomerase
MSMSTNKAGFASRIVPILLLALLVSLYLLHHDLEIATGYQVGPSICSLNEVFDCDALSKSPYSKFLGLPVAMYGSIFYGMLLLLTFFFRRESDREPLRSSVLFLAFLSLFPSLYLGYISYLVLGKICIFCSFLYLLNIFLFSISYMLGRSDGGFIDRLWKGFVTFSGVLFFSRGSGFPLSVFGLFLMIFFGQLEYIKWVLEPRYLAVYDEKVLEELHGLWKGEKEHEILHKVDALPGAISVGNKDAEFVLVKFSDYECPMCQRMSHVVSELYEEFGDEIKIIFLSFPLDNSCNRAIQTPLHPLACRLSKLVICKAFEDHTAAYQLHETVMHTQIASRTEYEQFLEDEALDEFSCFSQPEISESLEAHIELGIMVQIQGTPSFFLNGKRIMFDSMGQLKPLIRRIIATERNYELEGE